MWLDYKRNYSSKEEQISCFKTPRTGNNTSMPIFLHERDAHSDFYILKEYIDLIEDAVVHCFTGDKKALESYLDLGCYIGITGWITDPTRGYHLHDMIKYIPTDKLMIETDALYLMPFNECLKNGIINLVISYMC